MKSPILALALLAIATLAPAQDAPSRPRKKVLVELYTSQGCNSCPAANDLVGRLADLGYGPDRIVPVAFHVDYFNEPWVDPFSSKEYSRREAAYNSVLKRTDLYFTPMLMVDGRRPMLGSNRPEALASLGKALKDEPGASLDLDIVGGGAERTLKARVRPLVASAEGRQLMVGVAVTEGPITTSVPSGENAGKALVEPFVVRSFAFQTGKIARSESKAFTFPLKLAPGSIPARCRVSAWVQDYDGGQVHQAESIPWVSAGAVAP